VVCHTEDPELTPRIGQEFRPELFVEILAAIIEDLLYSEI